MPGEGAGRGAEEGARLFPDGARLGGLVCEPKPVPAAHRERQPRARAASPRPSSGALCITALPRLSLYLAVLGLLLQGALLQPVHGVLGRGGEAVSAQAAPFLHLGAGVGRGVAHCWETRGREGGWVRGRDRDAERFAPGWRRLPLPTGRSLWGRAEGKPVPCPLHLAEPPGSPWMG